jgi:Holliday junction resolvase
MYILLYRIVELKWMFIKQYQKRKVIQNNTMKESDYQRKIIKKLEMEGYYVLKLIRTNKTGIPDVLALKDKEIYFIECKMPNGRLSEIQKYRLEELKEKGFKVAVSFGDVISMV